MQVYIFKIKSQSVDTAKLFDRVVFDETRSHINYNTLPRDKNGKPLPIKLKNGSLFYFNISHSGEYLAIATSDQPVGIDIQTKDKQGKPHILSARLLAKILAPGEKPINNNPLNNFVIKEAFSKKSGAGLSLGFSKINANDLYKTSENLLETPKYSCFFC